MSEFNDDRIAALEATVCADDVTFLLTCTNDFLGFRFESPSSATWKYSGYPKRETSSKNSTRGWTSCNAAGWPSPQAHFRAVKEKASDEQNSYQFKQSEFFVRCL